MSQNLLSSTLGGVYSVLIAMCLEGCKETDQKKIHETDLEGVGIKLEFLSHENIK